MRPVSFLPPPVFLREHGILRRRARLAFPCALRFRVKTTAVLLPLPFYTQRLCQLQTLRDSRFCDGHGRDTFLRHRLAERDHRVHFASEVQCMLGKQRRCPSPALQTTTVTIRTGAILCLFGEIVPESEREGRWGGKIVVRTDRENKGG